MSMLKLIIPREQWHGRIISVAGIPSQYKARLRVYCLCLLILVIEDSWDER